MNMDRIVSELSSAQGGAIRLDQALGTGMTQAQVKYRLSVGRWSKLGKGSYLITPMTSPEDHLRAAIATLPGAIVSHEAAAAIHGLSYVERNLATVAVHTQTTHQFPGVIVRRTHDMESDHVSLVNGLPTTTPPRTIVDLAAVVSRRNLAAILDDAVAARIVGIEPVATIASVVGRSGKPGTKNLRLVLEERIGPGNNGTALERRGNSLLRNAELGEMEFEYLIPWRSERRFDAAYPDLQLAVEWDSRRWHTQLSAFDTDRVRDREAIVHGWRILRFTWEDVTLRPMEVVETVRKALQQDQD